VLQPTVRQADAMERLLASHRELYNAALEERIGAWRWEQRSMNRFEQFKALTGWDHPMLEFGTCPARGTLTHNGVGRLHLHGVGSVRFRGARRGIRGNPKTLMVRREGDRWRITVFCTDVPAESLEPTQAAVGIDLGVTELVATSDGELIGNPRHLRRSLDLPPPKAA
jgi:hypothetical protein